MPKDNYDPRYLAGIAHFNACDFFEAHEEWEHLWADYQGPSRKFYQGLIQTAVALHHLCNGNIGGAKKLYVSSRAYLQPYFPVHEGLDLEQLAQAMQLCFAEALAAEDVRAEIDVDPNLLPELHLMS